MAEPEDKDYLSTYNNSEIGNDSGTPTIIAIGVGGGGGNAINYMCSQDIRGVEFVALNTDQQALKDCHAPTRILLGPKLCKGRGAGGLPTVGREAAEESVPEIEKLIDRQVDMVFVTAGMGGGTGTGAAPVVARVCKEHNILTIGIVTIPFFFEGMDKMRSALDGAAALKKNVDARLLINNDRLMDIYSDMEWSMAFTKADDILATAARSISEMVTTPAMINIDMRDVNTTLKNGSTAFISVGYGEGENRMATAVQSALHSPLLCDTDILSARHLLFAFYYSHNIQPAFKMEEAAEINRLVAEMNKRVKVIFGWGFDDSLGNKVKFTLLASGFDVTVEHGGEVTTVEGVVSAEPTEDEEARAKRQIAQAYGSEKVEELERQQQTLNYYLLSPDELDNDDAIAQVEATPAYKRDKRKIETAKTHIAENSVKKDSSDTINFSVDDR